jgi:histidyl-tRNA synthetase
MQHVLFTRLGVPGIALELNNLGSTESRGTYAGLLREHLHAHAGELCGDCLRRTEQNPLRALDCKVPGCQPILQRAPSILDTVDADSAAHFDAVRERLTLLGIPYTVNPQMVRGLDYYTTVVFEFTSTGLGAKNTLSAGGRYDTLVRDLGGPDVPAVGFACGIERLLLLLGEKAGELRVTAPLLFVAPLVASAEPQAARLAHGLRERGVHVAEDLNRASLKSQMKAANRLNAAWVVLIGEDEVARGGATLRNMASGEQAAVAWDVESIAAAIAVHEGSLSATAPTPGAQ